MCKRNQTRKGFTLTEILVALAIFALGGTAIMALFITNVRLSRQAMDYTRAAEITRNLRSLMTKSMNRPINLGGDDNIYEFYYPQTSLTFDSDAYIEDYEESETVVRDELSDVALGGGYEDTRIFFNLPTQVFSADTINTANQNTLVRLPEDALNSSGGARNFQEGNPQVFRLLPDSLRRAGAVDGLDEDDRMFYQFDMSIRRSVQRSSVEDPENPTQNAPLSDLFVVHVKIYKGFEYNEDVINDPYFEWDFYINASR